VTVNVAPLVIVDASIASLNVTVISPLGLTPVAAFAGALDTTVGFDVSGVTTLPSLSPPSLLPHCRRRFASSHRRSRRHRRRSSRCRRHRSRRRA